MEGLHGARLTAWLRLVVLGLLGACADPPDRWPLAAVPIEGGTAEQREAVRAELLDFERWIGPGRLELQRIGFEPVEPPYGGWYRGGGVIELGDDLEGTVTIRTGTRHELCHALDDAEGLSDEPMPVLDAIVASLEQTEGFRDLSEAGWRSEAFAQTCEIVPSVTHLLATSCPEDDPRIGEIADWLLDRVWTASPPPPGAPLGEPVVFEPPPEPTGLAWVEGSVSATTAPSLLSVTLLDETGWPGWWTVERETGRVVDRDVETVALPGFDGMIPLLSGFVVPYGVWDTAVLGSLYIDVSELGRTDAHLVWLDEAGSWAPVRDGCRDGPPGEFRDRFVTDGRVWTAWFDGTVFRWAPISPP